ncbi:hypothetical protein [Alkalihalobacillus sp. BA299]|uniref:hypothetical protein n=1 Tax=Alkalihalobacillus sp. BA299 TaxID=2815938 RepID=UPI001ADBD333|nr:hypothetical protein [Alkalihalobacillus sp. BA299]
MKKILLILIIVLTLSMTSGALAAESSKPILNSADVTIEAVSETQFEVKEVIHVANPGNEKLQHTFSKKDRVVVNDLTFESNGEVLEVETNSGEFLDKIALPVPEQSVDALTYTITYSVNRPDGSYYTPLVVPLYASEGEKNVVTIKFTAPEGQFIHKGSFPIVYNVEGNTVENHLLNMPSHVNYKYGSSPTALFNSHNVASALIFILLVSVISVWFRAERKNVQGVA